MPFGWVASGRVSASSLIKDHWLTLLISDKNVCRTAPATPGLLKKLILWGVILRPGWNHPYVGHTYILCPENSLGRGGLLCESALYIPILWYQYRKKKKTLLEKLSRNKAWRGIKQKYVQIYPWKFNSVFFYLTNKVYWNYLVGESRRLFKTFFFLWKLFDLIKGSLTHVDLKPVFQPSIFVLLRLHITWKLKWKSNENIEFKQDATFSRLDRGLNLK